MLASITSLQLSEWMAYDHIEPFGEWRADLRIAMLAAIIANVNRNPDTKPFMPKDFMPKFEEDEEPVAQSQTAQIMLAHMLADAGMGVITHGDHR
jgi:hypothetical protein